MGKKYTTTILVVGAILIIISAKPLFLMGQEMVYQLRANQGLNVDRIDVNFMELDKVEILGRGTSIPVENITIENHLYHENQYHQLQSFEEYNSIIKKANNTTIRYARDYFWQGNTIRIEDEFSPGIFNKDSREQSSIHITINGKDWSVTNPIQIRPNDLDGNRYHGYLGLLRVEEKGDKSLVWVQRISGNHETDLVWRILTIRSNGQVQENQFSYEQRSDAPQRVDYINLTSTSPFSLGYKSNILNGWPSLFFPLLYPFVTAFIGFILLVVGSSLRYVAVRNNRRLLKR